MDFHVLTLFPEMVENTVQTSITGRAVKNGKIALHTVNIRDFADNKHSRVDDYPYGGGAGMVIQAEPVYQAYQSVKKRTSKPRCIYLTPQGKVFNQTMAEEFALEEELVFLCGHYEGIDERVLEEIVTDYVSIGDYVLTGGELAACVMIDAISRFVPGVLNNEESSQFESMQDNLLEYPHYTRPESWRGKNVPAVLLTGDHTKIEAWRLEESYKRTKERRPDLRAKNRPVTAAYFSPTGGTKKAAELLACCLTQNPQYIDLTRRKLRREKREFSGQELLLAAAPVYGGQLPSLDDKLFSNLKGNQTPCVIMAAYGNRHYDDTLSQMKKILEERGFVCIGAIAPVIPHIYSDKLGAGRPNERDEAIFKKFAVLIKKRIEEGEEQGFASVQVSRNPMPDKKEMKPVPKAFIKERCTGCQVCVQKCPVYAISKDTLEIDERKCISCMRCALLCKKGARAYDASAVKAHLEEKFLTPREVEFF